MTLLKRSQIEKAGWDFNRFHRTNCITKLINNRYKTQLNISGFPKCIVHTLSFYEQDAKGNRLTSELLFFNYDKHVGYDIYYPKTKIIIPRVIKEEIQAILPNLLK